MLQRHGGIMAPVMVVALIIVHITNDHKTYPLLFPIAFSGMEYALHSELNTSKNSTGI